MFDNKRGISSLMIVILIIGVIIVASLTLILQKYLMKDSLQEDEDLEEDEVLDQSSESINVTTKFFKIETKEISAPMLEGPAGRYGCQSDFECAFIIYNSNCELLPENACGNRLYYEIVGGECDTSAILFDGAVTCVCEQHKVQTGTPCSINLETGEEICVWVEDNVDYTYCKQIGEPEPRPDIELTDVQIEPQNPSVQESVKFIPLIKNIGNDNCSQITTWFDLGPIGGTMTSSWCGHYYSYEECQLMCQNPPCPVYFEPGQIYSMPINYAIGYNSSGSYDINMYTECLEPESDYNNNQFETVLNVS